MLGPKESEGFEVWPENWPAIEAFCAVQTQWAHGFSGITGLDYTRVRSGLALAGILETRELFAQLKTIEAVVLEVIAKKKEQAKETYGGEARTSVR